MSSDNTPRTPTLKQAVTFEPTAKAFGVLPGDSSSPKDVAFYLHNATNHMALAGTPIRAIFLIQFDVRSGYELKWSKKSDKSISLKGVEFKSLPSGLHEVEREVISFVQPKEIANQNQTDIYDNLLYGVSVYHQNLKDDRGPSRDSVKMFSLGILVDPSLQSSKLTSLSKSTNALSWKPIDYTKGLEYVDQLEQLLTSWDSSTEDFSEFENFFEQHSKVGLVDQMLLSSPRTPKSLPKLSTESANLPSQHHSHHFLLKLPALLEHIGPLIFKVWRTTLLRERVILFDAPSVESNCAFAYCLSILASIPQDLIPVLSETGTNIDTTLRYVQPIYSVGVNDIDWLKSLSQTDDKLEHSRSFIASSTDEILMYKTNLYDVALQFNATRRSTTKIPDMKPAEASIPGKVIPSLKSSQRDLKRFKIITEIFDLYSSHPELKALDANEDFRWWHENTEPASWKQLAWSGFYWWASAGEKSKVEEEPEYENLADVNEIRGDIEKSLFIVGYFQSMIRRIFNTILEIIRNDDSAAKVENGSDNSKDILVIEPSDLFEMGLDPYSSGDHEFVVKLIKVWWNRDAKIGSTFGNFCCL